MANCWQLALLALFVDLLLQHPILLLKNLLLQCVLILLLELIRSLPPRSSPSSSSSSRNWAVYFCSIQSACSSFLLLLFVSCFSNSCLGLNCLGFDLLTATSGFRKEMGKLYSSSSSSCCRHGSTKGVVTTIGTLTKSKQENAEHAVGVVVGFCDKEKGQRWRLKDTRTDRRDFVARWINRLALHLTVHVCVCLCFINV